MSSARKTALIFGVLHLATFVFWIAGVLLYNTGNAAVKFVQIDRYVWWRLVRLLVKRKGRNLKPGQVKHGRANGLWSWGCTSSWAPSATQGSRKPCQEDHR